MFLKSTAVHMITSFIHTSAALITVTTNFAAKTTILFFISMGSIDIPNSPAVANVECRAAEDPFQRTHETIWQTLRKMGQTHPTVMLLRETVTLGHAHALLLSAECYYQAGDSRKAMATYIDVLELHEDNFVAYLRLGDILQDQRKYDDALKCYERAKSAGYLRDDVFIKIAQIQTRVGDHAGALATVHDGVQAIPSSSALQGMRGYGLIKAGLMEEGLDRLSKAIELDRLNADAYHGRAYGYALLQRWDDAKADLDQALLLDPDDACFLTDRGGVRLFSGDIEGAIDDLTAAIAKDEELAGRLGAFIYRSRAYQKLGRNARADDDARRAQAYPRAHANVFRED